VTDHGDRFDAFAPGAHAIEAFGAGGFRFAGLSHVGSILATPKGVSAVPAQSLAEVDDAALARLYGELAAAPRYVEFVVIGAGAKMALAPRALGLSLKSRGLRFEAMATGPAARVYNVMLGEGRRVAALLIAAP
jgi:uncharacterized protein